MSFRYILCWDVGQVGNYSALGVLEEKLLVLERGDVNLWNAQLAQRKRIKAASVYHCRHLERIKLGTPYTDQVERVYTLMTNPELVDETALIIDQTGVGRPVVDMARDKGLSPIGVTIHGGHEVTIHETGYRVPKRDIVISLLRLFQSGRLVIAKQLQYAQALKQELLNFRLKISETGRQRFEAWREEDQDDLVLAVGIGAWFAAHTGGAEQRVLSLTPRRRTDWDPLAWDDEDEDPPFNPMQFPG